MGKVVGIDLGTTNSVVAVMEGEQPVVIPMSEGNRLCPSVVGFTVAGERLVGLMAKRQAVSQPDRTIASIKRKMGTDARVEIDDRKFTPQEISAFILQKLKADAESYLGQPVTQAVITVPAYFSDAQRQATKDAGTIAGLEVLRIINEPSAAALAYGIDKAESHRVLVWDLGGGTFDVSILEIDEGLFEVIATSGDTMLGGDDWDERIVRWMVDQFRKQHGVDLRRDRIALQRVKEAAERAKVELSTTVTTNVNLPFVTHGAEGPLHLDLDITRAQLEAMTQDLLERMIRPTRQALEDSNLQIGEIDRVLLVGGSTRMPAVIELVGKFFGKEPNRDVDPDQIVALGAATQGGILSGETPNMLFLDVTPLSLGIETVGGVMTHIIERNTTIPTSATQVFSTASDRQTSVEVKVYQGERDIAMYNRHLATFSLTGIRPAPAGGPRIEVAFDIDVNGIVHVTAKDLDTGRAQKVEVTSVSGLSPEEISKMIKDAEKYDAEVARKAAENPSPEAAQAPEG